MEDPVIIEVESDTEEREFFDQGTSKSGVESTTSPCLSDDRVNNSSDGVCSDVNSIPIHTGPEELNKQPKNDRNFVIEDFVDVNSAFLDMQGKYLQERWTESIHNNTNISQELVSNLGLCQVTLDTYRIQTLLFEDQIYRVRSTKTYDPVEVKMEIERAKLSCELKNFLRTLATQGIALLKKVNLLKDYIEIMPTRECTVKECDIYNVRLKVTTDMLTLSDRSSPWKQDEIKPLENPDNPDDFPFLKVSSVSTRSNERAKLKTNDRNLSSSFNDKPFKERGISIHTLLSLRTSIPSHNVFKQYLLRIMDSDLKTYLLVYHIGPLVEEWKVVLYQYRGNRESQLPREMSMRDDYTDEEKTQCLMTIGTNNADTGSMTMFESASGISEGDDLTGCDSEEEDGTALCCIVTEVLTENNSNSLKQIIVNNEEDDDDKEDDEEKHQEKPEIASQIKNTNNHDKESNTFGQRQLLLKDVINYWEEHEGRFTYLVTELKECLKYNILPVPNVQRKGKHKTKRRQKQKELVKSDTPFA